MSCVLGDTILWFSKAYPIWRENSKWPPYKLTISGFSSYLENYMRYLKKLNGICSGFVFARKHNSLIFKKNYPVWRENPKLPPYRVTISDFSSYLEILMRYLKNINGISLGVFALGDTFLWFWKTYPVLRKNWTYGRTDCPFPISLITREIDEISYQFKRHLFRHHSL